jgi:hypothetical protein
MMYLMQNEHGTRQEEIVIWLITIYIAIELVHELLPHVTHWVQAKAAASVGKTATVLSLVYHYDIEVRLLRGFALDLTQVDTDLHLKSAIIIIIIIVL